MGQKTRRKTGRNEPCYCGSGKKYKNCHLAIDEGYEQIVPSDDLLPGMQLDQLIQREKAKEAVRRRGREKKVVSAKTQFNEGRFVALGDHLFCPMVPSTLTFIDYLGNYIRHALGGSWGNRQAERPQEERHPFLQWHDALYRQREKHAQKISGVSAMAQTGAVKAYYSLAYNLYLLRCNAKLQAVLLKKIRRNDSFYLAYYESFVAAWLILAGFTLELEDEQTASISHSVFTATAPGGKKYSVVADARICGQPELEIEDQLYRALRKRVDHERIVFIELSVHNSVLSGRAGLFDELSSSLREQEDRISIDGRPAPPAYVVVTNTPYHCSLEEERTKRAFFADGFKIADYGFKEFRSLAQWYNAKERHKNMFLLQEAVQSYDIPRTYDGEILELKVREEQRGFEIGRRYQVALTESATLTGGTVLAEEGKAYLSFRSDNGGAVVYVVELGKRELEAYEADPERFFRRVPKAPTKDSTPMDFFEFYYDECVKTPREAMLSFFDESMSRKALEKCSDEELRLRYAERVAWSAYKRQGGCIP